MPVITLKGITELNELTLNHYILPELRQAVIGIKELELTKNDITFCLSTDKMFSEWDDRFEIIVFVDGLFTKPKRTKEVQDRMAQAIVSIFEKYIKQADILLSRKLLIECFVRPFNNELCGFATTG